MASAITLMAPRRPSVLTANGRRLFSSGEAAALRVAREISRKLTRAIESPRHTPRPTRGCPANTPMTSATMPTPLATSTVRRATVEICGSEKWSKMFTITMSCRSAASPRAPQDSPPAPGQLQEPANLAHRAPHGGNDAEDEPDQRGDGAAVQPGVDRQAEAEPQADHERRRQADGQEVEDPRRGLLLHVLSLGARRSEGRCRASPGLARDHSVCPALAPTATRAGVRSSGPTGSGKRTPQSSHPRPERGKTSLSQRLFAPCNRSPDYGRCLTREAACVTG